MRYCTYFQKVISLFFGGRTQSKQPVSHRPCKPAIQGSNYYRPLSRQSFCAPAFRKPIFLRELEISCRLQTIKNAPKGRGF